MPMQSRRKCTLGNTRKILVTVWIVSVMLSAPVLYVRDTESTTYYNNQTTVSLMFCADHGLLDNQRIHFAVYQFMVMFVVPTVLMIFCYTVVIYVLWISGKTLMNLTSTQRCRELTQRQSTCSTRSNASAQLRYRNRKYVANSNATPPNDIRNAIIKGRKQVIKMLITVIVVFLFSWGPKLIFHLFKYSEMKASMHTEVYFNLQIAIYCLPYIQSCLNPFIYGCMSKNFRKSVMTSCNSRVYRLPCRSSRNYQMTEIELESKYSNGTVQTKAV